ncbi:MAG: cobalamin-dependent protein [Deltaproteobacteria bacterium]|jgi:anaerobic magnesium-protoporphyrin IX monomethyl ester cyclase|nr:cobalamin-dependent protein [Deltaproteobacteria bacterium]MBK9365592.1 cobalamin-dependent protein [Deltaproteobacteria bacterium]
MSARRVDGLRVALVYPPYGPVKNEPGIKTVKENYGIFPSLSLLYVAGILESAGAEVLFIDAHAEGLTLDETVARLEAFGPSYIGYTITTYLFFQTLDWIKAIKARTGTPTIVGGVHLSIYPRETLTHEAIDYAVTGEAELSLPNLLHALENRRDLRDVKGVAFRVGGSTQEGGEVIVTPTEKTIDVDEVPFPARRLIDNSLYYSFISKYKNFTCFITSRGCPYKCIFCEQGSKAFRARSPKNVVDELELCVNEFGIRELDFFDSSFTIRKDRVIEICEEINRRKLDIVWAARTRVDCITKDVLSAMRRAGCARIYYGVESGNREILKVLKKSTSLELVKRVVRETREEGIDTFGYFMLGNPYETPATIRQTIRLAIDMDLDYAQFSKVTPMPATEMYTMMLEETGRDYWREFVLNPHDELVPRPRCTMTDAEIQRWTRIAYLRFYYRPEMIKRQLSRVKSVDELRRSAETAWQMIKNVELGEDSAGMEVVG